MALADPQSITINAVPISLPLISVKDLASQYSSDDEVIKFLVSHQDSKGRSRRMVRVDKRVVAANPLTAINEYKTLGVYLVIDEPEYGFTDTEIDQVVQGLKAWLTSANVLKVCTGQH